MKEQKRKLFVGPVEEVKADVLTCTAQVAAVFASPNVGSARVGQVSRGAVVEVLDSQAEWVRIAYPAGWVPAEHLA